MPRLVPDFLQRIKDVALQRIDKRIRQELAPDISAPPLGGYQQPGQGQQDDLDAPNDEMSPDFYQRIKNKVKDKARQLSPIQQRLLNPEAPLDLPTIKYRIEYAAQNNLLLLMSYNGQQRQVESYSYRTSGTADPAAQAKYDQAVERARSDPSTKVPPQPKREIRFYGFCLLHNKIHAFKLEKIDSLIVTNIVYRARWTIEIGQLA